MDTLINNRILDSIIVEQKGLMTDSLLQDTTRIVHYVQLPDLTNTQTLFDKIGIPVIVSIAIFILGFIINEIIYRWRQRKELEIYKSSMNIWWKKGGKFVSDYIKSLENFAQDIYSNNNFNIAKWATNLIHISKLSSISIDKATSVFVLNLKAKSKNESSTQMVNFFNQLDYLDKITIEVKSIYNEYVAESRDIMQEWNTQYMGMITYIQNIPEGRLLPLEAEYVLLIHKTASDILKRQANDEKIGPKDWNKELIKPSMEHIASNSSLLKMPYSQHIANYIKGLEIAVLRHNKLNSGFSAIFQENAKNIQKAYDIIDESIEYLNKYKIK